MAVVIVAVSNCVLVRLLSLALVEAKVEVEVDEGGGLHVETL